MKLIVLISCGVLNALLSAATFGQSSFRLDNAYVNAPVFGADGARLAGPNYAAELWGGATSDSLTPALTYITRQRLILTFLTGANAGFFIDPGGEPLEIG